MVHTKLSAGSPKAEQSGGSMGGQGGVKMPEYHTKWAASNPCPSIKLIKFENSMLKILNIPEYSTRFFIFLHKMLFF
jgi:hypothetical protein